MKFKMYNKHIIQNEIAGEYQSHLFYNHAELVEDGNYILLQSHNVQVGVLRQLKSSYMDIMFGICEEWTCGMPDGTVRRVEILQPLGYETLPEPLVYAERCQ